MGEREIANHILDNLEEDDVFYDIGANVGLYTCLVANILSEGQILAVKPHPKNVRRLRENLERNGISATVCEAAVGDEKGTAELEVHGSEAGEGKHSLAKSGERESISVDVVTADDLISQISPPSVIKIDIEGAELIALKGLEAVLDGCRLVYCEVHPEEIKSFGSTSEDVYEFMESRGFKTKEIMHRGNQPFVLFKSE
ncbi:FkbM family methyltransferase [Halobacterium salinarum]|uniref:FkbM family methyltransferase n=1 Tax=Halobacterium salinarum TaxID=2242 RepID=UPI0025532BFA|nr:FkbM family methyltransferase [Halobacterium salinarum]MDL0141335.1 FkbM family methyltransferase [Halobacterium salinarum]